MFYDIVTGKHLNSKLVEEIRRDLIHEYNNRVMDNPFFKMYEEVLIFTGTAKSMPIGKKEDLLKISFEDIRKYFILNYQPDNLVLLCSSQKETNLIYSIFNDIFTLQQNFIQNKKEKYTLDSKKEKLFHIKKIKCSNDSIHIFVNSNKLKNGLRNDFIQCIIFTIFDEISNEIFKSEIISTEYEILHFTKKDRYMHFTLVLQKRLNTLMFQIERIFFSKSLSEIEEIVIKSLETYFISLLNEEPFPNKQLNIMLESYLFNVQIFKKDDMILTIKNLKKEDIIEEWINLRQQIQQHKDIYIYQFFK